MIRLRKFIFITGMIASQFLQKNKKRAKKYFDERSANKDIVQLKKAESPSAKTLSIKLEEKE